MSRIPPWHGAPRTLTAIRSLWNEALFASPISKAMRTYRHMLPLPAALFALLISSCSQYYYIPNMHQVPLLREKGEARIAYAGSTESVDIHGEVSGSELQASAAVSDKIGVMLNGAVFTSAYSEGRGRFVEAGAGRLLPLGPHWTAEMYAGIGRGDVAYEGERTAMWRLFSQPSIGYASRNFDFAVTARLCYLDHDKMKFTSGPSNLSGEALASMQQELTGGRMLIEPGFVLRAGTRSFKLQIQYAHSTNLGRPLSMLDDNISVGFQLNLNNSFRKRQRVPNALL